MNHDASWDEAIYVKTNSWVGDCGGTVRVGDLVGVQRWGGGLGGNYGRVDRSNDQGSIKYQVLGVLGVGWGWVVRGRGELGSGLRCSGLGV